MYTVLLYSNQICYPIVLENEYNIHLVLEYTELSQLVQPFISTNH